MNVLEAGYDGLSPTYQVTGLTSGKKYRFGIVAENKAGLSEMSYYTIIVAASLPSKPTLLSKNSDLSNETSITVQWSKVADTETETSGYILNMAEFGSSNYQTVYTGYNRP